jgi:hypothetical protein
MNLKHLIVAVPAALCILCISGNGTASAGETINEAATTACATDKWEESEPEKGHKLVDFAGRCVCIDNDPALQSRPHDCVGKYEYMLLITSCPLPDQLPPIFLGSQPATHIVSCSSVKGTLLRRSRGILMKVRAAISRASLSR